jgi:hypothetical protein
MAISPNTNFTSGQILTATNANQWPRGVVAYAQSTTNSAGFTTEITTLTASTFTAVADRYYRVTYIEPVVAYLGGTVNFIETRIKNGATLLQVGTQTINLQRTTMIAQYVGTFTAGTVTLTAHILASGGGDAICSRAATGPAFIMVEDMGPA